MKTTLKLLTTFFILSIYIMFAALFSLFGDGIGAILSIPLTILMLWVNNKAHKMIEHELSSQSKSDTATSSAAEVTTPITQCHQIKTDSRDNMTTTQMICKKIWAETLSYAKITGAPDRLGFHINIWSALYFCILDIIRKNGLEYEMRRHFLESTCTLFDLSLNNDPVLNSLLQSRQFALDQFSVHSDIPPSREDMLKVHHIALMLSDLDKDDDTPPMPTAQQEMEFIISVANVTRYSVELLSSHPAVHKTPIPNCNTQPQIHSNKSSNFHISPQAIFVGITLLIVLLFCIPIFSHDAIPEPIETTTPTTSMLKPAVRPANGSLLKKPESAYPRVAPFSVDATGCSVDFYIILKPISDRASGSELQLYVRANSKVKIDVPLGIYQIYSASGSTWYGKKLRFGKDTYYELFDGTFSFEKDPEGYLGWTLKMDHIKDCNLDSSPVSSEDFPQ